MNENEVEVGQELPLTEATFFILLSLATGRKHGYAIMKDVEAISDGRVAFSTGTLYGALRRLLDQGWIERIDEESEENGRSRKVYALSDLGERILSAERARLESLVAAAAIRLIGNA